jgi:hypothetical protein
VKSLKSPTKEMKTEDWHIRFTATDAHALRCMAQSYGIEVAVFTRMIMAAYWKSQDMQESFRKFLALKGVELKSA